MKNAGVFNEGAEDKTAEHKYKQGDYVTYTDLDYIFGEIKKQYPSVYPCAVLGSQDYSHSFIAADPVCSDVTSPMGVIMMDKATRQDATKKSKILNYYETDEYKAYVNRVGSCNEKGRVYGDALTTRETHKDLINAGKFVGYFSDISSQFVVDNRDNFKEEFVQLLMVDPYWYCGTASAGVYINSRSPNAAKALQFTDLVWSDRQLCNLLCLGNEGAQWKFVEDEAAGVTKENGMITVPEGVVRSDRGYETSCYGNIDLMYYFKGTDQSV